MRIFKNRWFARFAAAEGIDDNALRQAVEDAENGLVDADLGGFYFSLGSTSQAVSPFRQAFGIPEEYSPIGAIAIGYPAPDRGSASLTHRRAITTCLRFLLHGMVFTTREGQPVVLKAHLLRHTFATHAVQVEKIPFDIFGAWLKQKNLMP